jgi:hypothetical protein
LEKQLDLDGFELAIGEGAGIDPDTFFFGAKFPARLSPGGEARQEKRQQQFGSQAAREPGGTAGQRGGHGQIYNREWRMVEWEMNKKFVLLSYREMTGCLQDINNQKTFVMKDFALIFRVENNPGESLSPAEMQQRMTVWMNWMGGIAAKDRLVSNGTRLGVKGSKWVGANGVVSDGPYTEVKEFINGYIIVRAETPDEAAEMAKGCPILMAPSGKVEVRPLVAPDNAE